MRNNNNIGIPADWKSWVNINGDEGFPIQHLPYGAFESNGEKRLCTRIGGQIIDLKTLSDSENLTAYRTELQLANWNGLFERGKNITRGFRIALAKMLKSDAADRDKEAVRASFRDREDVRMILPIHIGDYTDFYSSRDHATNVGKMFRDPENALLPNWLHIPVGYHGRSSSIVVSGTPIKRPAGQVMPADSTAPVYTKSKLLDFELEMAFVVGEGNSLGSPISIRNAEDHIQGLMLFNDWSARDIQKWEYVPLGPFLGKNFASTVSPWIVDLDALREFRIPGPKQEPPVLDYLQPSELSHFDIHLEVWLKTEDNTEVQICRSNHKHLYWSIAQQLAHHTVNGCNMRSGDLCASGTISGPTPDSYGSMLELSWRGTKPIQLPNGEQRKFLQDGDTLILKAFAEKGDYRIDFGECEGKIMA